MKIMKKSTIIVIILLVLLAICVGMYFYTAGGQLQSGSALLQAPSVNSGSVGIQELALLRQVQSIRIDSSFFSDPVYGSLVDYTETVTPHPVGRSNPFSPVSGVSSPTSPSVTPPSGSSASGSSAANSGSSQSASGSNAAAQAASQAAAQAAMQAALQAAINNNRQSSF